MKISYTWSVKTSCKYLRSKKGDIICLLLLGLGCLGQVPFALKGQLFGIICFIVSGLVFGFVAIVAPRRWRYWKCQSDDIEEMDHQIERLRDNLLHLQALNRGSAPYLN